MLIIQHPLGNDPVHWLNSRMTGRGGKSYYDMVDHTRKWWLPRGTGMIVYSQYLTRNMVNSYPPQTRFATNWDDVIQALQARHKGQPKVAVYPYGGLQEQELSLDA